MTETVPYSGHLTTGHHCHAENCTTEVPPILLMCRRHWRMVPYRLQQRVKNVFVPGQEVNKNPSRAWVAAARAAIASVAAQENQPRLAL